MIVVLQRWFDARSVRERRLLQAMAAIALPLLLYLALIAPLTASYRNALQEHLVAVDRNGRVKALAEPVSRSAARQSRAVGDLALFLADEARQRGIAARAEGSAARASVTVDQSAPSALFAWMAELEASGFRLEEVRIAPLPEGGVSASLAVRQGVPR